MKKYLQHIETEEANEYAARARQARKDLIDKEYNQSERQLKHVSDFLESIERMCTERDERRKGPVPRKKPKNGEKEDAGSDKKTK